MNLISQSNITATSSSQGSENSTFLSIPGCACATNNDIMMTSTQHPETDPTDGNLGNEATFAMINKTPSYYEKFLPVSTIIHSTTLSSNNTRDFIDLFSPSWLALRVSVLAITITVLGFALVSSIASCYIACRMYQRGPLLPIGTPFHQQN